MVKFKCPKQREKQNLGSTTDCNELGYVFVGMLFISFQVIKVYYAIKYHYYINITYSVVHYFVYIYMCTTR